MSLPHEILRQYWGYGEFRPLQLDIIQSALAGVDTLALLPTGGGKSLCFQVPALCVEGVCVVVSPLIALMKDQVENLQRRGIEATAIYSGMPRYKIDRALDNCVHGQVRFLYLSPERLCTDLVRARLVRMRISFLAVDEAHCISQWGYDFRPSYVRIAELRELLPNVPIIALTATATPLVVEDIQEKLAFRKGQKAVFQKSFARDNLAYVVLQEENKRAKMLDILKKVQGSGVVYVQNRRETKETAQFLQKNGISADFYHAGLDSDARGRVQDAWIQNKTRIIVATNAFGMGIDKPDVRVVVHLTLPEGLEAYFQEAGRGGRDGEKAYGVLLYNSSDRQRLEEQYAGSFPPLAEVKNVYRALGSYYQLAIGSAEGESFEFDLLEFCRKFDQNAVKTLSALKLLMQEGYLELSEQVFQPASLQIICSKEVLYDYLLRQATQERLIKTVLRLYQGINLQDVPINEFDIAKSAKMSVVDVGVQLKKMQTEGILRYQPQSDLPRLTFLRQRLHERDVVFDRQRYEFLRTRFLERITAALHYAESSERCRSQILLAYFGETQSPPCGKCDVCTGRTKTQGREKNEDKIKRLLMRKNLTLHELLEQFPTNQHAFLLEELAQLLQEGFIEESKDKKYSWSS